MKKNTMLGLVKFNPIAASILLALPIVTQAVTPSTRGTNVNQVNGVTVIG